MTATIQNLSASQPDSVQADSKSTLFRPSGPSIHYSRFSTATCATLFTAAANSPPMFSAPPRYRQPYPLTHFAYGSARFSL